MARAERTAESRFQVFGECEIEIVAAEHQVFADCDAMELHAALFAAPHANQRKVGRAAADVANQDLLSRFHAFLPVLRVLVDPGVKRGLRFFDQDDTRQAGASGGFDRIGGVVRETRHQAV